MTAELDELLLNVASSPLIDSGDRLAAARLILATVRQGLSVARASIWLHQGPTLLHCELLDSHCGDDGSTLPTISQQQIGNYFAQLGHERTLMICDTSQDPRVAEFFHDYLQPFAIGALLDAPIRHHGQMIGIVSIEHIGGPRQWLADEINFAANLADLYGRAVSAAERVRYEQQLEQANNQLEQRVTERTIQLEKSLTDLRTMQNKLIESEKMAALGNLVAGVAHEVNSPLGVAITAASHCREELKTLEQQYQQHQLTEREFNQRLESLNQGLGLVEHNLERAANLVRDFKRTAADQSCGERAHFTLDEYLNTLASSLGPLLRQHQIQLQLVLPANIECDSYPGALAQVITNLAINAARYAFPEPRPQAAVLTISASLIDDDIFLQISDNGIGMSEQIRKRVFEPFFTTGRNKGGTGLGLALVYNLVTQTLGGTVRLSTAPHAGSHFDLCLPRIAPRSLQQPTS